MPISSATRISHQRRLRVARNPGHESDEKVLRTDADGERQEQRAEPVRVAVADAFEQERHREEHEDDRRDVAERAAAEEPDVREEREQRAGGDAGREPQAQLAREHEHRHEDEHRRDDVHGLQRAKIVVHDEPREPRHGDEHGEARRMRMVHASRRSRASPS